MLTPVLLGLVHAVVDASTVSAVFRSYRAQPVTPELAFALVVTYDLIAFGSQVVFGWLTDRFTTPKRALMVGLALTAVALVSCRASATVTVLCAGVGNALFHLGAGATVLRGGLERSAPAGIFVAPGALGLAFGMAYGMSDQRGPLWPLLILVLVALTGVTLAGGLGTTKAPPRAVAMPPSSESARFINVALSLLLVSIAVRALVGLSAARGYPRTESLIVGIPIAAFFGKFLGGYLADRLGWIESSVGALLISIPLIAFAPPVYWLLVGLFAFQMTMPVTLTAVACLLPHRLATAFGWTCLALILGSLPTMFSACAPLCERRLLGWWIALGAVCVYIGLRLLGIGIRRIALAPLTTKHG